MNYYEILGINLEADQATITQAAQIKAKELNSEFEKLSDAEKHGAYQVMQAKANQINVAFRILSHPEQREAYNKTLLTAHVEIATEKPALRHASLSSASSEPQSFSHWTGKFTTIEKPESTRDIVIFVVALLFFLYMLSGFLIPSSPVAPPAGERPITRLRAN
jgi:DnaJ-class molecular chaperone